MAEICFSILRKTIREENDVVVGGKHPKKYMQNTTERGKKEIRHAIMGEGIAFLQKQLNSRQPKAMVWQLGDISKPIFTTNMGLIKNLEEESMTGGILLF